MRLNVCGSFCGGIEFRSHFLAFFFGLFVWVMRTFYLENSDWNGFFLF